MHILSFSLIFPPTRQITVYVCPRERERERERERDREDRAINRCRWESFILSVREGVAIRICFNASAERKKEIP